MKKFKVFYLLALLGVVSFMAVSSGTKAGCEPGTEGLCWEITVNGELSYKCKATSLETKNCANPEHPG